MSPRGVFSALALSALLVSSFAPVATAAQATDSNLISGVIVSYAPGVSPIAKNGEPTGANHLRGDVSSEALGGDI